GDVLALGGLLAQENAHEAPREMCGSSDEGQHGGARRCRQQGSRLVRTPLCDWQAVRCCSGADRPRELAQQERRFGRAAGTPWTPLELSPGDSSLVHRGRTTVATAALWGAAMGELLSADRLGTERHRLDAVWQDAHAPGLDLERDALVLVGILPLVAHGAALDQHPHALLVQRLPVFGLAMPQFHWRPEAAAIFIIAVLLRDRVVEIDVQSKQPARLVVAVLEFAVVRRRTDVALADEVRAHGDSLVVDGTGAVCPWTRRR